MRWRRGYSRVVKKFALFPVKAYTSNRIDQEFRWLEIVYLNQIRDWLFGFIPYWRTDSFASKSEFDWYCFQMKKEKEDVT